MKIEIENNIDRFISQELARLEKAKGSMSQAILNRSLALAPYLTGALRNDGRIVRRKGQAYVVKFGSAKVPYARLRHFVNRKNPQTLKYLMRAGESVEKQNIRSWL